MKKLMRDWLKPEYASMSPWQFIGVAMKEVITDKKFWKESFPLILSFDTHRPLPRPLSHGGNTMNL